MNAYYIVALTTSYPHEHIFLSNHNCRSVLTLVYLILNTKFRISLHNVGSNYGMLLSYYTFPSYLLTLTLIFLKFDWICSRPSEQNFPGRADAVENVSASAARLNGWRAIGIRYVR